MGKWLGYAVKPGRLRNVEDAFPKFDANLKRFVDIDEAINLMIKDKHEGDALPAERPAVLRSPRVPQEPEIAPLLPDGPPGSSPSPVAAWSAPTPPRTLRSTAAARL